MMRAVQLTQIASPLEDRLVPTPVPGRGEVLVRVGAAGVCHSDVHYRDGVSYAGPLPLTLGHEVAGTVQDVGAGVATCSPGDSVCLHYLIACGSCDHCRRGREQFCASVSMIGKHRDGGFAEFICVPSENVHRVPAHVTLEHAAIMMCSSATAHHALVKARLREGERVAVFGVGGLGTSAVQLARAMGASEVFAVDVSSEKLAWAVSRGAVPIDATGGDPAARIRELTADSGVDVALEFVGREDTIGACIRSTGVHGRAAMVALTDRPVAIHTYRDLVAREVEVIGVSDHLPSDIESVVGYYCDGSLDLSDVVGRRVPLAADAINSVLDDIDAGVHSIRAVVVPA